jgi:hypothetical protein
MKLYVLLTLWLASALLVAAHAQTTNLKSSGAYAQSNFPNVYFFVGSGDVAGTSPQPVLDFSTFIANPDGSYTYSFGYGNIPNSAFTGNNAQHMSLNVDTSQVPGFQTQTCTVSYVPTYSYTCTDGPFGVIQLDWQNNGYSSSATKQALTWTNGPMTHSSSSDSTYVSANASGTFLGAAVTDYASTMGTDKNRYITITKGN